MAQMNISNLLWNDSREAIIALAKQLKDDTVTWNDYHYTGDDGQVVYPFSTKKEADKFQAKLNEIFLTHYTDFQTFLHTKGIDGVIDTWKDVEDFLENITDDEAMTLMKIVADLEEVSGHLNIRMSPSIPGMIQAVTTSDAPLLTKSYIDSQTGAINIIYTFDDSETPQKKDLGDNFAYSASSYKATSLGTLSGGPILTNSFNVPVTYTSSDVNTATVSDSGVVTVLRDGHTTIKAEFAGDRTYKAKTVSYALTVELPINAADYVDTQTEVDSPEFKKVITDSEEKVLWGRHHDDTTTDIDLSNDYLDGVSVQRIVNAVIEEYNL